jgi:hypothetical protein
VVKSSADLLEPGVQVDADLLEPGGQVGVELVYQDRQFFDTPFQSAQGSVFSVCRHAVTSLWRHQ